MEKITCPRRRTFGLTRLIRLYQLIVSPFLGNRCRFYPSCSHYATDALLSYGIAKGCWLTIKRLLKCHPWHAGGVDFVPEKHTE